MNLPAEKIAGYSPLFIINLSAAKVAGYYYTLVYNEPLIPSILISSLSTAKEKIEKCKQEQIDKLPFFIV